MFLFPWLRVMAGMLEHEIACDQGCDDGEYSGYEEAKVVECPSYSECSPYWCFVLYWRFVSMRLAVEKSSQTSFITKVNKSIIASRPRHGQEVGRGQFAFQSRSRSSKGHESWVKNISCSGCCYVFESRIGMGMGMRRGRKGFKLLSTLASQCHLR